MFKAQCEADRDASVSYRLSNTLARPDRVFRLAGLLTCAITGLNTVSVHLYGTPGVELLGLVDLLRRHFGVNASPATLVALDVVVFVLFGAAFWRNLDGDRIGEQGRAGVWLLALQSALGLLFSTALFFIVAAEVCFVLPRRAAFLWVMAQMCAGVGLVLALPEESLMRFTSGGDAPPVWVTRLMQSLMYPMILSFSYCLGLLAATERRHRRELARVNAELKATQALQADSVRLAERLSISRELHDALGHQLAALSINLQLAGRLAEGDAAQPVKEAHVIARTLLSDVREVVGAMRHGTSIDLRRALETLAAGIRRPRVHVEASDELSEADPLRAHTLFRCAQEMVTNAVRHSGARNVWLRLESGGGGLTLEARDDGRGAESLRPGNGLRGMRERVEESGGELNVETSAGGGFSARVWLPAPGGEPPAREVIRD